MKFIRVAITVAGLFVTASAFGSELGERTPAAVALACGRQVEMSSQNDKQVPSVQSFERHQNASGGAERADSRR